MKLGAVPDADGTHFSVFSTAGEYGGAVELSLLDTNGHERRIPMTAAGTIWNVHVPDIRAGQRYGYRATGPFDPARGLRFDQRRLLADPYARAMEAIGPRAVHSLVVDEEFDWGDDARPQRPRSEAVIYETHVQGISIAHPKVPADERGSYRGLCSEPILTHLRKLGVTAVELMPVHHHLTEQRLLNLGMRNYWGYMTLGFFAPHAAYRSVGSAAGSQIAQFKEMVKALHQADLEVILDVVYNHTAEGDADGPALCYRGLANEAYYRLDPTNRGQYVDTTGTGNSLDVDQPEVLALILDSLRYWVEDMHVDGFRFDLAPTLARHDGSFNRHAAFLDVLGKDPVLSNVTLIAEPWDLGDSGYQLGNFPLGWAEWNDRFRDGVREFWAERGGVSSLATRLAGSSDTFDATRGPGASVNFLTAHDGLTLADLVTYSRRHNEINGDDNFSFTDDRAQNFGVEGPTNDPQIKALRGRQQRNLLATLLLAQGVPMLLGGDERGRTQQGDSNAYCQANDLSWYDWSTDPELDGLVDFTANLVALRHAHPALRRSSFLDGTGFPPDITWFDAIGAPMTRPRWENPNRHFLAFLLRGDRADQPDQDLLIILNADSREAVFPIPGPPGRSYRIQLDTNLEDGRPPTDVRRDAGMKFAVPPRTVIVAASQS